MKKILVIAMICMLFTATCLAESDTLVVYYSATGTTGEIANQIAAQTGADMFLLEPIEPYTEEDLDWTDPNSRVVVEHESGEEPMELVSTEVPGWEKYQTVYIGYPIWWQDVSWVMDSFVQSNDFTGKTVVPFCTSQASGYGESGSRLAEKAGTGNWIEGIGFFGSVPDDEIAEWLNSSRATA